MFLCRSRAAAAPRAASAPTIVLAMFTAAAVAVAASGHRPAAAQDPSPPLGALIGETLADLETDFPAGDADAFRALVADTGGGIPAPMLGQVLYMRRHFDRAVWFFGTAALDDPTDAPALSNFAAMLAEMHASDPATSPPAWLKTAIRAAEAAVALAPEEAAFHDVLGQAARRLAARDGDADLAAYAVAALERATALAPGESLYWANLAQARALAGDAAGAAAALARARALDPNGPAVLMAAAALRQDPAVAGTLGDALAGQCDVDFRCQETCPRSIIGQIDLVTCEMENASARSACAAGEPYMTGYDCSESIPEYGILIPGLNSGFSVGVPGFSMHVVVDGEGNLDVRVEVGISAGPMSGYVRTDGHYQPGAGVSFSNVGSGVRVSLINNSPAGQLASDLGHPPAHIEAETLDDKPTMLNVELYNAGVISI